VPLNQVANISVPEPRMLSVSVWDKGMVGAVERGIRESNLGLNPIIDGQNLRIPLPELNEERRKSLVKVAHDYAEKAKVAVRHVRRDGMDDLKKAEKDGDIGQDLSRSQSEKVQKMTDDTILDVDRLLAEKEKEIMQV
jgi:ribosome recycling factor